MFYRRLTGIENVLLVKFSIVSTQFQDSFLDAVPMHGFVLVQQELSKEIVVQWKSTPQTIWYSYQSEVTKHYVINMLTLKFISGLIIQRPITVTARSKT
jgi:hypothetical protein